MLALAANEDAVITRTIDNAIRLGTDAFHTAAALDLVAPLKGRTWVSVCVWCLESADPRQAARAYRVRDTCAGGCARCAYSGRDTIVASLAK